MERDDVWIPQTPEKPALNSEQRKGKENIIENSLFADCSMSYTEKCVMNEMCEGTTGVQGEKSCVQGEIIKISSLKHDSKMARGVDGSQDGIDSIPTPSKTKETKKRRNDGKDVNKKPSQRSRVKKHRPKIFDDSKPKKAPKAQTPRGPTVRPKTPKPGTPNWGQERRVQSRKKKVTVSTNCGIENVGEDIQEASRSSIVFGSCKRFLDFNGHPFDNESKSHDEPPAVDFEKFDCFRSKIVTSRGNTLRWSKFQNKSLKASDNLLGDNIKKQQEQDISVTRNQEHVDTNGEKYVYFYQRRKKISSNTTRGNTLRRSKFQNKSLKASDNLLGDNIKKQQEQDISVTRNQEHVDTNGEKYVYFYQHRKKISSNTTRGNTLRRSKFQNKSLKASDNLLGDNIKKQQEQDISVTRNQEHVDTNGENYVYFYQRRKKISSNTTRLNPTLLVYRRLFKEDQGNQCLLYSKKCGPNFPKLFKKQRTIRKKVDIKVNHWYITTNELQKSLMKRSHRKQTQATKKKEVVVLGSQSLPPKQQDILHTREDLDEFNTSDVEHLIPKIASRDINGQFKELVVHNQNVSGALVKVLLPKKRKMVPKVDLDSETLRVWKLLMENDESEPLEKTDKDKEEWWEAQRNIFRGRVDSFIAKMHLIQGNRRFSPWKGSVTDSVVGVYLTQNVSDNLSSSAFMSLAARFPAKSGSKEVGGDFEVPNSQESVASNTQIYEGFSKNNEMEQDISASYADVNDATPTMEPSQTSLQVQNKPCADEKSNTFQGLLEVKEADYLKQFCRLRVDESESLLKEMRLEGEEESASIFFTSSSSNEPSATTFDINMSVGETSESEFIGQQKSTPVEEPTPICSLQSEVTTEQRVDSTKNHKETPLENKRKGKKKNKNEKKQEPTTEWEEMRKTYCKTGEKETNVNYRDAVDWDAVRHASEAEIAKIIVDRGMQNVIASYIKEFLDRMYKDHGTLDLEWLRDIPPVKAKEFLLSIQGLGLKSVECVRLLTLHHNAFPVDTNVGRVATRLGWVPLQPLPDAIEFHRLNAYPVVDNIQKYLYPRLCSLDKKKLYELHYQLITFGKVFCTKIKPNCNACPMRAECRHYASAFASGRLALPGTKESSMVTSIIPAGNEENQTMHGQQPSSFDLEVNNSGSSNHGQSQTCEPIIEVPPSPEPEAESIIGDIEDLCCESDDDEIPTIRLNTQEFRETLKETIETNNISIAEADMSKALIAFSAEGDNIRVPRKKFSAKSRTMHLAYELPDFHPSLAGFEERERDDPTPYLLAIWFPGEIPNSLEYTENRACVAANNNLEETVKATILIPCRTATRGTFPLNGTYFQLNEVFADDETSHSPIDVPRRLLCNLPLRELGCGSSATSIFKALSTGAIQRLFWRGSICVRGFNRETRQPQELHRKFHIKTTAMAAENRKSGKR